jgi:hypothetical protein
MIRSMRKAVRGLPSDLTFNMDEVTISESKNCKPTKVAIPATFATQTIHNGISQNLKPITIITCGSACLRVCEWSMPYSIHDYIPGHRTGSPAFVSRGDRHADLEAFDPVTSPETVYQ